MPPVVVILEDDEQTHTPSETLPSRRSPARSHERATVRAPSETPPPQSPARSEVNVTAPRSPRRSRERRDVRREEVRVQFR
eukprot:5843684-Prymnesium_polylepis.1